MSFTDSLNIVLRNEGGYANDPQDAGGETYAGISREFNPNWEGWNTIDASKPLSNNEQVPAVDNAVYNFYYQNYWLKNSLDKISNPHTASLMLDTCVNHGYGPRIINRGLINAALLSADYYNINHITTDAINAINNNNSVAYNAIVQSRLNYVNDLINNGEVSQSFATGLLNRVKSFLNNNPLAISTGAIIAIAGIFFFC